jgi:histidinol phosphatase-like PHP family hydrolase
MKKWQKYSKYLETGDWHCHTKYTDGRNTVLEMCRQARKNGLKLLAFTDHVRKKLPYNFDDLVKDVEIASKKRPGLKIIVGCETKVLDEEGNLDVSQDVLDKCEIVLATFHSFPNSDKKELESALKSMLKRPEVDIWTHPITFFQKCPMCEREVNEIIRMCSKHNVLIEDNIKPRYRSPRLIEMCRKMGARTVIGSDAHGIEDLRVLSQENKK